MKILLQNKNIALANNSLISINSDNIVENGNLVRIKQNSKNNIIKINNSLVRAKVASDPPIAPKETWVINDTYSSAIEFTVSSLNFISNGKNFTSIAIRIAPVGSAYIKYNNTTVNNIMVNALDTGIRGAASWINSTYRTITFLEPPTSDLLTWLQANAVKQ